MTNRLLAKASIIALCAAVTAPMGAAPAVAQEEPSDEIVVTGSFIRKKSQADLPSPLTTLDATQIDATGAVNIADLTQTLTINTGAQNNPDAFTQNATTGTSNINLRGLGVGSTLVLLNGRRQVLTASTTNDGVSFVDTASLVPMIAIDRVEILKDGASALYGSDAVAGVANFITRDGYEGILLSGDYTSHQSRGSYNEFNLQGLAGKQFGIVSLLAAVSYTERTALTTAERRLSVPANDTSALGNPGAFFLTGALGAIPAGTPLIDPGCAAAGGFPLRASPTAPPPSSGIGFCGFDFGEFFNLVPEEERLNLFGQATVDFSDSFRWRIEGGYADNSAVRGNSPTFPFLQLGSAVVPGGSLAGLGITPNPFNILPTSPTVLFFGRASGNGGEVSPNLTDNETWRFSTALGGDLGDSGAWEISYTRARNNFTINTEDTVTDRFQCALTGFQSLPAIPGLTGGTNCTGSNPDLTANGAVIPAAGTFFNPFSTSLNGVAPNPAGLLDYVVEFQTRDLQSDVNVIEGFVSGDLFELPAGPVGIAVGGQYRDNDLAANFDEISLRDGFGFLIGEQPYGGSQDVFGGFVEVSIPVTSWLDLQAAVRHERYGEDEGGSTTDPKVALLVRPVDRLSLRGSYSTSFRAPSVFQQVGQQTTLQQVVDPLNSTAFVAVRQSGEADLVPENSRAFNGGASFEPIDGLTFDVDYYNFSFENFIVPLNAQALINANPLDPRIIRGPSATGTGTILQVNTSFVNAAAVDTSGIDFGVRWEIDAGGLGVFTPSFEGTYILTYDLQASPGGPVIDGAGNRNFTNFGESTPELRFNAGLGWRNGAHSANLFVRRIGSYFDDQPTGPDARIDSDIRVDIQYAIAINEYMNRDQLAQATIGVRNLTGTTAPFVATNGGFDSRVADPRGALLYFGLNLEF
jgi:iron complex outermembrane receptor protein